MCCSSRQSRSISQGVRPVSHGEGSVTGVKKRAAIAQTAMKTASDATQFICESTQGDRKVMATRDLLGLVVSGVGMADHADARVGREDATQLLRSRLATVSNDGKPS